MTQQQILQEAWSRVADYSSTGAQGAGQVADWLLTLGVSAQSAAQILNNIATSAAVTPTQAAFAQSEMQFLSGNYQPRTNWVPILVLGAIIWAASKQK